jgi:hypothetical protein
VLATAVVAMNLASRSLAQIPVSRGRWYHLARPTGMRLRGGGVRAWAQIVLGVYCPCPLVFGGCALVMSALSAVGAVTLSTGSLVGLFVVMGVTAVVMVFIPF